MDLIIIIINDYKTRKLVKAYLKEIGLGDFIVMPSRGTSSINQTLEQYVSMSNLPFDSVHGNDDNGKTIFVVNKEEDKTEEILDEIAKRFKQKVKERNSGLAFSVPVGDFFATK